MTAAKVMDIISRLLGCDGQAPDAVSAYTQVKMEDAHKLLKIPESECPDIWIRLPRHKWPKSWSSMEDLVVPVERNLYCHPLAGLLWGKAIRENLIETWLGENSKLGMSLCSSWKRIILICVCGWHKIGWKETKSWSDVESTSQRSRFGRTNIFFDHENLGCTQRQCEISKDIVDNYRTMLGQNSKNAKIRTLLDRPREQIITAWEAENRRHKKIH